MYNNIYKFIFKFESNSTLSILKKALVMLVPVMLTGSVALLFLNFPVKAYTTFISEFGNGIIRELLLVIFNSTVGLVSIYLVLALSFFYSNETKTENTTLKILASITALTSFAASYGTSLDISCLGPSGAFTAIISTICSTKMFYFLQKRINKDFHAYSQGADFNFKNAMTSIIPLFLSVSIFAIANLILVNVFAVANFNDLIANAFTTLFMQIDNELLSGILFVFFLNLLWAFGIHGGNALKEVGEIAFASGGDSIITKSFMDNFALMGGCGLSICLLISLLLFSKIRANKRIATMSAPLVLFNINEIMIFGLPVILNPIYVIPFVVSPIVALLIAYFATAMGFMPIMNSAVSWTTPILFSGYITTNSISGIIVQLIIIVVGVLIYIPFVRLADSVSAKQETRLLESLIDDFKKEEGKGAEGYLVRQDSLGVISKLLVSQLRMDIENHKIAVFYQPQISQNNKVEGAEALLRWTYKGCPVYPPLVIDLAVEDGCMDSLTWEIFSNVCTDIKKIRQNIQISANMVPSQLNDTYFVEKVIALVKERDVCGSFSLEVTEGTSLESYPNINKNIDLLKQNSIKMSIDDFSMGQTSLNYLKNNNFSYVKIDGELVKNAIKNPRCCDIISSIAKLGESLGFGVVAEYVETKEVREVMEKLGCKVFQGYYYSKALPCDEFIAYCSKPLD